MIRFLFLAAAMVCALTAPCSSAQIVFVGPDNDLWVVQRPAETVQAAIRIVVAGPTYREKASGITSAIPESTSIISIDASGDGVTVDLTGPGFQEPLPDDQVDTILQQVDWTARGFGLDARVLFNGKQADSVRFPQKPVGSRTAALPLPAGINLAGVLNGKKITISPGHGYQWNGSSFSTQRPVYCAPLSEEDLHNLEISLYLTEYLLADGAIPFQTRETDLARGNHPQSGKPWWQMCAPFWLYDQGYPLSVCSPNTGAVPGAAGVSQTTEDRRSRPEASNYDGTDLYVSLHTNGLAGDCYTGCPSGIEMYVDETQNGGWFTQSSSLGSKCQIAVRDAVQATYSATFPCRNSCIPRTNQAFAEIHYPERPACLLELGFHDSCLTDAVALRDNVFRSAAMWGMYKGICDFYGVTPTWPLRSYELVSSDLPTLVKAGSSWTSHITLKNRGCVWNEAHQFRLGSVNSADPFGGAPRFTLESEIAPGQTVTFSIAQTAPAADGAYPTVWRMVQDERAAWFGSPVYSVVSVDAKPPTSPAPVNDGGPNQSSTTQIAASWAQSTDAKAGLNRYEYRVTDAAGTEIVPWTSTGLATSVTIDGTFAQGGRYFVWVKAVDNFDWETEPVSSPGVTIAPDAKSIGQAKSDADGAYENLQSKKVTGVLGDHIYVQEPDRSSGIRVDGVWTLAPGASVDVLGKIATANSERKIVEAQVTDRGGTPELPAALVISALHSGGAALNSYTPGVANAYGLHNIGLRVQVCGIVSAKTATGFRLNDGSLPDDGSGAAGILIESGSFHQPDEGAFAIVTGIPSFQPGSDIRRIVVAQDSDILP